MNTVNKKIKRTELIAFILSSITAIIACNLNFFITQSSNQNLSLSLFIILCITASIYFFRLLHLYNKHDRFEKLFAIQKLFLSVVFFIYFVLDIILFFVLIFFLIAAAEHNNSRWD